LAGAAAECRSWTWVTQSTPVIPLERLSARRNLVERAFATWVCVAWMGLGPLAEGGANELGKASWGRAGSRKLGAEGGASWLGHESVRPPASNYTALAASRASLAWTGAAGLYGLTGRLLWCPASICMDWTRTGRFRSLRRFRGCVGWLRNRIGKPIGFRRFRRFCRFPRVWCRRFLRPFPPAISPGHSPRLSRLHDRHGVSVSIAGD